MTATSPNLLAAFTTMIGTYRLDDADLVGDLEQAIWMLEEGDTAGAAWCETQGYDGYTSYASLDDLPMRATAFADLKARLDAVAADFAGTLAWDMSVRQLVLDSFWVNVLAPGGVHSGHIHPNAVLSGTVYVTMPDGAGAIRFEDPRLDKMMAAPPVRADAPDPQRRFLYRTPLPGEVLIWESWLRHEVMQNRADVPRLSVSFNYGLVDA